MVKKLMLLLAALTSLSAALIGLHSFVDLEGSPTWIVYKVVSSAAIVGVGILTWLYGRAQASRRFTAQSLLVGAMLLLVFGAAGVAWTLHLAQVSGDFEAWAVLVNLIMIAQGALTIWHLWSEEHRVSPARS